MAQTAAERNTVMKPRIGITCNFEYKDEIGLLTHMGAAGQKWHYLADHYVNSIERAGGIPVLIPICGSFETVKEMVSCLDGVLISGGHDVNPREYGMPVKKYSGEIIPQRDSQDIALAKYVLEETKLPLLCICRGIQVMNVAAGGTLRQDLEIEGGYENHSNTMFPLNVASHQVELKAGTRLEQIFGKAEIGVNSFHHQAVLQPGDGFSVTAVSEDGVIEALELPGERFVLGVQWHPEMMYDSDEQQNIFRTFISACRNAGL